jgi:hypothetical protein
MGTRQHRGLLLFCLASDTDWVNPGVSYAIVQHLLVKNPMERDQGPAMWMRCLGGNQLGLRLARYSLADALLRGLDRPGHKGPALLPPVTGSGGMPGTGRLTSPACRLRA